MSFGVQLMVTRRRIQDFPDSKGEQTPTKGAPTCNFDHLSQEQHEIEKNWTERWENTDRVYSP